MTNDGKPSPWFWELLESSNRRLRSLSRALEQLPKDRLRQYRLQYDEAKALVNPCYWDECGPYLADGCSEDHGGDFAAWVVMQGRAFFEQVRSHPAEVGRHLATFDRVETGRGPAELRWDEAVDRAEYRGYQRADYLASPVYEARFGEDLEEACYDDRGWPRQGP